MPSIPKTTKSPKIPQISPDIPKVPPRGAADRIVEGLDPLIHLMQFMKPEVAAGIEFVGSVAKTGGAWIDNLVSNNIIEPTQADMLRTMPTGVAEWFSSLDPETQQVIMSQAPITPPTDEAPVEEQPVEPPMAEAPQGIMSGVEDHNQRLQDAMNGKF